jgi:hypothetical protein
MHAPSPAHPRCFATTAHDPYVQLASEWVAGAAAAAQREALASALAQRYRAALEQARDAEIGDSLRGATSPAVYRCLARALDTAVNSAPPEATVLVRVFAFPILIVTGGRAGAVLPGVLPEVSRLREVLQTSGALGPVRNFGLANALGDLATLQAVPPSRLYQLTRGDFDAAVTAFDLPPAEVTTSSDEEEVHLRFLAGAAVTPAQAPSFLETASAIATWGMAMTQELGRQMRAEDLSVLPIPRPPATPITAPAVGWIAREELALQVFLSRALRRFRGEIGEPEAALAVLDTGELGLRVVSPFVEDRVAIHCRSLHPSEELSAVVADILGLLKDCRMQAVEVLQEVVPAAAFRRQSP